MDRWYQGVWISGRWDDQTVGGNAVTTNRGNDDDFTVSTGYDGEKSTREFLLSWIGGIKGLDK